MKETGIRGKFPPPPAPRWTDDQTTNKLIVRTHNKQLVYIRNLKHTRHGACSGKFWSLPKKPEICNFFSNLFRILQKRPKLGNCYEIFSP